MAEPARSRDLPINPQTPVDSLSLGTAGQSQSTLPTPAGRRAAPPPPPGAPQIAGYQLLDEIARGGMGCVYGAIELQLDRDVAIKTLLPGRDANRFITEAQITARLPHPSIPPVYELGSLADGAPYLAMKRIHGQTLADLLKDRSDPQSELPRFVQIFEQIAQAVGFAHHRGIIHRDLKPLNVMVGEFGEVQVMDWGLAKELGSREAETSSVVRPPANQSSQTTVGYVLGTPGYLAPEQARGETVDARADVFALGSLLAAILTGQPAITGTTRDEMIERAAREEFDDVAARLSASGADEELVALARRCLAARADDRPANGREVAAEVAAYRASVEARLHQAETERARAETKAAEQLKRRRVLQWAAAAIALVLIIGIVGTGWGLITARSANALTAKRLQQIEKINNSVFDIFTEFDVDKIKEQDIPVEAALADKLIQAGHQLDAEAISDPVVLASLQHRLGRTLLSLGKHQEAIEFIASSRNARLELLGPNDFDSLITLRDLAMAHLEAGQYAQAMPLLEETLQRMKASLGPDNGITLSSQGSLARGYEELGQFDRALPLLEITHERMVATLGADHRATHNILGKLANGYLATRQFDRALPLLEEALQRNQKDLGPEHPQSIGSLANLGQGYQFAGKFDKALPLIEKAVRLSVVRLGTVHPDTLGRRHNLALAYYNVGRREESLRLFQETLELMKVNPGPDHPNTLTAMDNLFHFYMNAKELDLALPLVAEALERRKKVFPPDHPDVLTSRHNVAMGHLVARDFDKALPMLEELTRDIGTKFGADHCNTITTRLCLGGAYCQAGKVERAEKSFRTCIDDARKQFTPESRDFVDILTKIALEFQAARQFAAAEKYLRESLAIREEHDPDAWRTFHNQSILGEILLGQEKLAAAEPLLVQGYEGLKAREKTMTFDETESIPAAIDLLITLYKKLDQPDKVARYESLRAQYPEQSVFHPRPQVTPTPQSAPASPANAGAGPEGR